MPKDFLDGWSSTMAQHAEEEDGAATAEAPGLFRRRLAGLVVINGAMVEICARILLSQLILLRSIS